MHILLCEDQDSIRRMLEVLIRARGFHVTSVSSGARAIELALLHAPDLVLLDILLPGPIDGLEVCRRLRKDPSTRHLPIMMVSALDDEGTRLKAISAGANAYVAKPFSPTALLHELDRLRSTRPASPTR